MSDDEMESRAHADVNDEFASGASPDVEADGQGRFRITPRQGFIAMAVVLIVALVALVAYLLFMLSPDPFLVRGGEVRAGIRPIMVIGGPGQGQDPAFARPMGATYGPDDRLYVADTENDRIVAFDDRGRFLFEFGGKGIAKPFPGVAPTWEQGLLNYPLGMDVDAEGNLYVADFRNDQIQVFDADGNFLRRFPDPNEVVGKGGSGQGGTGIAVTDVAVHEDRVYAIDTYQVVVFTTEGELVDQFGRPGDWIGELDHPNGIDVGEDGTIYVSDSNNNRVIAFDQEGGVVWQLGEPVTEIASQVEHVFGLPRGLAVLDDGTLLVVDAFEFELVHVSPEGQEIGRYGDRGGEPAELNFPNSIAVRGDELLVTDKENDRVQVLELVE